MKVDLLVDFNFEPTKETMETFCQIHKPKNLVKKTKFCKNPVNPFMIDLFFTNKPSSFQNFTTYMACNGVLTPLPSKSNPPKSVTIPPVLKFFTTPSPQSSNFLLSPLTGNGCFCIFHTWLLPTSTCSYFWSYYNWLNAVIIDF